MPRRVHGILYSYIKIFAICTFRKIETLFYDEVLFAIKRNIGWSILTSYFRTKRYLSISKQSIQKL